LIPVHSTLSAWWRHHADPPRAPRQLLSSRIVCPKMRTGVRAEAPVGVGPQRSVRQGDDGMLAYTYPLLSVFWTMLWIFLFVIWIWLLIAIFADIFRSEDMGGFHKALWVIFIIILPFLGVFVYLIARGGKMQERAMRRAADQEQAFKGYVQDVAASSS